MRLLAEHDAILAAERAGGGWCVPVFQWRSGSAARHLRDLLAAGTLGPPLLALCHTLWYRGPDYYAVPWRGRRDTEIGGATTTQGIHAIDLLLWLLPDWAEVTAGIATLDRDLETETVSMAQVRFASGALAGLVSSVLSPAERSSLRLDCRHATVQLEHLYQYDNADWTLTPAPGRPDPWAPPADEPASHTTHLARTVARLRDGSQPEDTAEDARRTVEFLTALYKSALTGAPVSRGGIGPDDPFYRSMWG
ncbi:Gfo/Idh/MocA family protein [Thermocatellispora tengchongensis]|uniref:Gfo/Idh/MocA family protein n=1 Tax=Thermocatellispora tengchongensis TaxID=1073253 RepID=UPI003636E3CF